MRQETGDVRVVVAGENKQSREERGRGLRWRMMTEFGKGARSAGGEWRGVYGRASPTRGYSD